jgi:hypothetical protein
MWPGMTSRGMEIWSLGGQRQPRQFHTQRRLARAWLVYVVAHCVRRLPTIAHSRRHLGVVEGQPSLPPECSGRSRGSSADVVRQIRGLGDIEILKSYLLLVWSEWDHVGDEQSGGLAEMQISIREDFVELRCSATGKISSNGWTTF